MDAKRPTHFIHPVETVFHVEDHGGLDGSDALFAALHVPETPSFRNEFVTQRRRIPELGTLRQVLITALEPSTELARSDDGN